MRAIPRFLITPLLLALPLVACDPRNEEEASLPLAHDLSPAEIIQRVLDAENSIESVREDRTDISTQVAFPSAENADTGPDESRSVRIQVGDDSYIKYEFAVSDDFCDGDPDCLDTLSPLDETLYYKGTTYYRDRSGTQWVLDSDTGCSGDDPAVVACERLGIEHSTEVGVGTGGFVDCPALESVEPTDFSQVYSFEFSWLTNPQRMASAADDAGLIHVRGSIDEPFWSLGLSPEIEAAYAECGIDPKDVFGEADIPAIFRDYIPDRFTGAADIWVDPVSFFVQRLEWSLDSFNGDRLLQTEETVSQYSLFNEAELPGPLPD